MLSSRLVVFLLARDQGYRVVAAAAAFFALVRVRMTNLTRFPVEITILPSSYHRANESHNKPVLTIC